MSKPAWWHLLDRAYKMMLSAGYRVMEHDPDQNDPIGAWMSDARVLLQKVPDPEYVPLRPDLRRLHDSFTEVIARGLHYNENFEKINALKTAAEVQSALEGGFKRYRNDPIFHSKVQTLVALLMQAVQPIDSRLPEPEKKS